MTRSIKVAILAIATFSLVWSLSSNHMISPSLAAQILNQKSPSIESDVWLNSQGLTNKMLLGKVYMVEFWTFDCYNCVNVEPYVKKWHKKYKNMGFEVVSVHSPEFSHEKDIANVRDYVARKQIRYPVAIDNDFTIWKRFNNRYWPAMYLVDKKGVIRYAHFGEGRYAETEKTIQKLLKE